MIKIFICLALVAFMVVLTLVAWYIEHKNFNGGVCPKCGHQFKQFDNDSQGGRGYRCEGCGNITWVSYPFIDGKFKE